MPRLVEAKDLHHASNDQSELADRLHMQRAELRLCLDEIASEVGAALEDAALAIPLFLTVPSGGALLTFCTPGDPSDDAWEKATEIISAILSSKILVGRLIALPLACAASGATVNAGEVSGGDNQPVV